MNPSQYKPFMFQTCNTSDVSNWVRFDVRSFMPGQTLVHSHTTIKTPNDKYPFIDISIEAYAGPTRRAKYVNVRLEEEAARLLYAMLKEKFA